MPLTFWLRPKPCRLSAPRSVQPRLEALEDRLSPSTITSAGGATAPPPSQQQALLSLFIDGAAWEANNLSYQFIYGDDLNIDNFFGSPDQLAIVDANVAAAGIDYTTVRSVTNFLNFLYAQRSSLGFQSDIAANAPYAGPFAEFAVLAGAQAVLQAVQLSPVHVPSGER